MSNKKSDDKKTPTPEKSPLISENEQPSAKATKTVTKNDSTQAEANKELEQAKQKAQENWDLLLRAKAELENVSRRSQKEIESARKYGLEKLINELVPVLDSFEQGILTLNNDDKTDASIKEGMQLAMSLFLTTLKKFNVEQIDPQNKPFDPQFHEAMSMLPNNEVATNTVLQVIQKGYLLNERVIRPARVIVSTQDNEQNKTA